MGDLTKKHIVKVFLRKLKDRHGNYKSKVTRKKKRKRKKNRKLIIKNLTLYSYKLNC